MSEATVLVIDDEPLARRRLVRMLADIPDVRLIGEAGDVDTAYHLIRELGPDLLLLDINMPGASGFDLLERLGKDAPVAIFVTAFDHHALRAFDLSAADYVTKPIDAKRVAAAVERAVRIAHAKRHEERLAELSETISALRAALRGQDERRSDLWVKTRGSFLRIPVAAISSIQAERDYVRIFSNGASHLHHESLAALEKRLDGQQFVRIHRSAIIRLDRVVRLRPAPFAALVAVLDDGSEIRVGRTYGPTIRQMLLGQDRPVP